MDTQSLSSPITPPTPPRSDPGTPTILTKGETRRSRRKNLGWAPPTLHIPQPVGFSQSPTTPRLSASQPINGGNYTANISMHGMSPHPNPSAYQYTRKASRYVFNQFNDIKDFTIGTARSGLGIGEKCSFWCYNKLSHLSRRWFTHFFLTIVIVIYTVGGALIFIQIEGSHEKAVVTDLRTKRRELLIMFRNLSLTVPEEKSMGEWLGEGSRKLQEFEQDVIDWYNNFKLLRTSEEGEKWTFWNTVFYCSTIYTTIGKYCSHFNPDACHLFFCQFL
ncbi:hypothetical protein QE152_g23541 [Popillia japonica]|uniref:Uncharacterized protein n=1 Tax=Popillia japonica TaxID=7064 RepID=A0AAW1KIA2_POPJA